MKLKDIMLDTATVLLILVASVFVSLTGIILSLCVPFAALIGMIFLSEGGGKDEDD